MTEKAIKKPWYKRWWAITLVIIIGLGILSSIFGNNNGTDHNGVVSQTPADGTEPAPTTTTYHVGDSVAAGDFTWVIANVSRAPAIGEGVLVKQADGEFLILTLQVQNTANSAKYLDQSGLTLVDAQGRTYSPDAGATMYLGDQALIFAQVNPGVAKQGEVVYDVPKGLKVSGIKIASNILQSQTFNVQLS